MAWSGLAILIAYGLVVTLWKVIHVLLFFYKPKRYFLRTRDADKGSGPPPMVSLLLAAKDEEANIGACVRSVLGSDYERFELIVIDDRSADRTSEEVEAAAAGDPRVRLIRVEHLPDGWTGKMNAIRQGLARARGELVLIMDADTRHRPETLRSAVALQREKHIDLLSLLPRFDHPNFLSKLVQPLVGAVIFLWKPLPWVNSRKRKHVAMGWGGFLMMRRAALDEVGGLEAVRDRFAADIALSQRFKAAGYRVRLLHAPDLVSTYMYDSAREMVAGWSRLLRITVDNRASWLSATLVAIAVLGLSAYLALAVSAIGLISGGGGAFWVALAAMALMHLALQLTLLGRFYRISGSNPLYVLGHLPALLFTCHVLVLALWRSRSARLTWRGTTYALNGEGRAAASGPGSESLPTPSPAVLAGPHRDGRSFAGERRSYEPDRHLRR